MFNDNVYDQTYLKTTLNCLKNEIEDLEKWSVYNRDKGLDMIAELKAKFGEVQVYLGDL